MDEIFVDTGLFKGIVDKTDNHHEEAKLVLKKILDGGIRMVCTNFVLDETFTLVRKGCGVHKAKELQATMGDWGEKLKWVRVMAEDESRVWEWFWFDWRDLSYTDCTSFAVMERLGIKRVATFDEHFAMAGFERVKPQLSE